LPHARSTMGDADAKAEVEVEVEVEVSAEKVEVEVEVTADAAANADVQIDTTKPDAPASDTPAPPEHQQELLDTDCVYKELLADDGTIDKAKFITHFVSYYHFTRDEAMEVFDKWDTNHDHKMSRDEYDTLTAELEAAKRRGHNKAVEKNEEAGCCIVCCGVWGFCIAWTFCICTIGISVCIFCCCFAGLAVGAATQMKDTEREEMREAKSMAMRGPGDNTGSC